MNILEEKRARMLSLVSDWRSSGQTQKDFCAMHGIKIGTFSYWVAQSREISEPSFIALEPTCITSHVEVIYPNGVKLKVDGDLGLLSQLIHLY